MPAINRDGNPTVIRHQIAQVTLPLSSVGEYCDAGNRVFFGRSGGIIENIATGATTTFTREQGVYLLEHWIPPPEEAKAAGFTRPGK